MRRPGATVTFSKKCRLPRQKRAAAGEYVPEVVRQHHAHDPTTDTGTPKPMNAFRNMKDDGDEIAPESPRRLHQSKDRKPLELAAPKVRKSMSEVSSDRCVVRPMCRPTGIRIAFAG